MVGRGLGGALLAGLAAVAASAPSVKEKLQAIQDKLGEQGDKDKEAFDKVGCWCEEVTKELGQLVDDSNQDLTRLGYEIKSQTAESARLNMELKSHQKDLDANTRGLDIAEALREKDNDKFTKTEASQVSSVESLDSALKALKRSHGHELSLRTKSVRSSTSVSASAMSQLGQAADELSPSAAVARILRLNPHSKRAQAELLHLSAAVNGSQSPDVVYGVLKEMHGTFSDDLEEMRAKEVRDKETHDGLVSAKTAQINTIKKQMLKKQKRAADRSVQVQQKTKKKAAMEKLVESNHELFLGIKGFCGLNDASFQKRQEARQAEVVALSAAQADVASTHSMHAMGGLAGGFLVKAHRASRGGGPPKPGSGASELCMAALEIVEQEWRSKAKDACEQAKAGKLQEAGAAADRLKEEIEGRQSELRDKRQECEQSNQDRRAAAARTAEEESARADVIGNRKEGADSDIESVNKQIANNDKAAERLTASHATQHQLMQETRLYAYNSEKILKQVSGSSPEVGKAISASEKLVAASDDFDKRGGEATNKVMDLFNSAKRTAVKALIPLKLMRAEAMEAAVSVREEQETTQSGAAPTCDPDAFSKKAKHYGSYIEGLSKASETLAYEVLKG